MNNKLQWITSNWLRSSGLSGNELLLEALLRRGFLAYGDEAGIWLGTGSHTIDLDVLRGIRGIKITPVSGHQHRMASLKLNAVGERAMNVAIRIVSLYSEYH